MNQFDWNQRIEKIIENNSNGVIRYEILKKQIFKEYRQIKPNSDKTTDELTRLLEKHLRQSPFLTRLGDEIYYLYFQRQTSLK